MSHTLTILRREFLSYWRSPIGYVVLCIFLGLNAYFSLRGFTTGMQASATGMFRMWPIFFVIFLPAVTMRLWAEERMLGTLELMLTYPSRVASLVLGKFLGAFLFLVVMLILTLPVPSTIAAYTEVGGFDWNVALNGYLGALLMAAAFLAIGLFWSSLTGDQIVAYLISFLTLLGLNLTNLAFFENIPRWLIRLMDIIGLGNHYTAFVRGVINLQDVIYFLAVAVFFLWLNGAVLVAKKWRG